MLDSVPPHLTGALILGLVGIALFGIAGAANSVAGIIWKLKRQPPLEETLSSLASRDEINQMAENLRVEVQEAERRNVERNKEVDERLSEQIKSVRDYNSRIHQELFQLIRAQNEKFEASLGQFSDSMNNELRAVARELGQLSEAYRKEAGRGG